MAKDGGGRGQGGGNRGRGGGRGGSGANNRNRNAGGHGQRPSSGSGAAAVPANWPRDVAYLATPVYAGLSAHQRRLLQTQPADLPGAPPSAASRPLPEVPPTLRYGPSPLVEIRILADPAHPACGQRGLFAARALPAGSFVLPYLGVYHRGNVAVSGGGGTNLHDKKESDYDLWLDRDADVAVDAARQGNEARFVNDYRGVPGKVRPNAEFREVWDPRRGERGMAVFVLPAGKRKLGVAASSAPSSGGGIAKGEEILVSYGKGFWEMRQKEAAAAAATASAPGESTDATEAATAASSAEQADVQSVTGGLGALKVAAEKPRPPAR